MKIVELEQGTDAWKEFRRSHVGASDIPTLMLGGDKEILDLYLEKDGLKERFVTDAMRQGTQDEPIARDLFNSEWGYKLVPAVGISEECPWLMASFDGFDGENILEIKRPVRIPDCMETHPSYKRWWWQVQAQLCVSGLQKAFLMAYNPSKYLVECVHRDEDAIEEIKAISEGFYNNLKNGKRPEGLKSLMHRDDDDASYAVIKWLEWKQYLKIAEREEKEHRDKVIALTNGTPFECHGVKVELVTRKGNIDYDAIPVLEGVDLELYRKKSSSYWKLTSEE